MALVNAGRNFIAKAIINDTPVNHFDNTGSWIGVGNGTGAVTASQTNLLGTSTDRKIMTGTYPTISTNVLTFKSSFNDDSSQFTWNEWGVFNGSTAGTMLSRKQESLGAKGAGQTWDFTVTLTVNIGT